MTYLHRHPWGQTWIYTIKIKTKRILCRHTPFCPLLKSNGPISNTRETFAIKSGASGYCQTQGSHSIDPHIAVSIGEILKAILEIKDRLADIKHVIFGMKC